MAASQEPTVLNPLPGTQRRRFLTWMTVLVSGAIASVAAVPILGAVLFPLARDRKKQAGDWKMLSQLHELEAGVPKRVEIVEKTLDAWSVQDATVVGAVWLLKESDTQVKAFSTICPHLGCAVNHE